jgi:phosphatidylglycerophosphate synthase
MSKPDHSHGRPPELEDWLNRTLYHPLSRRLAQRLQFTPVTPNAVSVASGLMVVAAAAMYFGVGRVWGENWFGLWGGVWAAMLGLLLHLTWHVLDGADGDLARMTGRSSQFGEIIDGVCDYLGHVVLYFALGAVLAGQIGPIGWLLMAAAGFARAAQTVFFETQRRQYQYWVYDTPWLRNSAGPSKPTRGSLGVVARFYLRLSNILSAGGAQVDAMLAGLPQAKRMALGPFIKAKMMPVMTYISVLSSNYRTLVIGIAMIAGQPIGIVIFELGVLSVFLWSAMRRSHRAIGAILAHCADNKDL